MRSFLLLVRFVLWYLITFCRSTANECCYQRKRLSVKTLTKFDINECHQTRTAKTCASNPNCLWNCDKANLESSLFESITFMGIFKEFDDSKPVPSEEITTKLDDNYDLNMDHTTYINNRYLITIDKYGIKYRIKLNPSKFNKRKLSLRSIVRRRRLLGKKHKKTKSKKERCYFKKGPINSNTSPYSSLGILFLKYQGIWRHGMHANFHGEGMGAVIYSKKNKVIVLTAGHNLWYKKYDKKNKKIHPFTAIPSKIGFYQKYNANVKPYDLNSGKKFKQPTFYSATRVWYDEHRKNPAFNPGQKTDYGLIEFTGKSVGNAKLDIGYMKDNKKLYKHSMIMPTYGFASKQRKSVNDYNMKQLDLHNKYRLYANSVTYWVKNKYAIGKGMSGSPVISKNNNRIYGIHFLQYPLDRGIAVRITEPKYKIIQTQIKRWKRSLKKTTRKTHLDPEIDGEYEH